jgi:hypothetical protein
MDRTSDVVHRARPLSSAMLTPIKREPGLDSRGLNREFVMQPFEPSDGCLALRKSMANGSND